MNQFGGDWTNQKIEIVVSYAKAYLTIMNAYPQFKCLYFDGFAGSGDIYKGDEIDFEVIKGAAIRILGIDFWILVPTGIGMNRLLTKNGDIKDSWLNKLEIFLGLTSQEIKEHFYRAKTIYTLFGEETLIEKEKDAIAKAAKLYQKRLNE